MSTSAHTRERRRGAPATHSAPAGSPHWTHAGARDSSGRDSEGSAPLQPRRSRASATEGQPLPAAPQPSPLSRTATGAPARPGRGSSREDTPRPAHRSRGTKRFRCCSPVPQQQQQQQGATTTDGLHAEGRGVPRTAGVHSPRQQRVRLLEREALVSLLATKRALKEVEGMVEGLEIALVQDGADSEHAQDAALLLLQEGARVASRGLQAALQPYLSALATLQALPPPASRASPRSSSSS